MSDSPSMKTNESAKNPMGQHDTMGSMPIGKHPCGSPELNSTTQHVISPTSTMGHNSFEHGSKKS